MTRLNLASLGRTSPNLACKKTTTTRSRVTGSSNSGRRSLLIAIDAGMLMTEAVMRFWAGTPKLMYVLKTEPAIVENP